MILSKSTYLTVSIANTSNQEQFMDPRFFLAKGTILAGNGKGYTPPSPIAYLDTRIAVLKFSKNLFKRSNVFMKKSMAGVPIFLLSPSILIFTNAR